VVPSAAELIRGAVERMQAEAPALARLKLVFGLELRGRGDIQAYRVEVPGPRISKGFGDDERVHVSVPRSHFNELAAKGRLRDWREAYQHGHVKVEGDPEVRRLIGTVIERQLARARLRRAR
jgi:hypothetical protein